MKRRGTAERPPPPDWLAILRTLHAHGVRFVLIGGIAGTLHGSTTITYDLDVCYDRQRSNLEALAAALRELGAYLRGADPGLPFKLDAETLHRGLNFTFTTRYGDFDCLREPAGGFDYDVLAATAEKADLDGWQVLVAGLDDLIRMKRAAGRTKDRVEVENLSALREVIEKQRRAGG